MPWNVAPVLYYDPMGGQERLIHELFMGLKALYGDFFPRTCPGCGTEYLDVDDFLKATVHLNMKESLPGIEDLYSLPLFEMFRKCSCGATVVDFVSDRRDNSEAGIKRRQKFEQLMGQLEKRGLSHDEARTELLKLMHGEESPRLHQLG